ELRNRRAVLTVVQPGLGFEDLHDESAGFLMQPVECSAIPEPARHEDNRTYERGDPQHAKHFHDQVRRVLKEVRHEHGRITKATDRKKGQHHHEPQRAPTAMLVALGFRHSLQQLSPRRAIAVEDERLQEGSLFLALTHDAASSKRVPYQTLFRPFIVFYGQSWVIEARVRQSRRAHSRFTARRREPENRLLTRPLLTGIGTPVRAFTTTKWSSPLEEAALTPKLASYRCVVSTRCSRSQGSKLPSGVECSSL